LRAALRADRHDVPREVAQQITAGYPSRQREALLGGRAIDAALDLELVAVKIGESDAVANQGEFLRARAPSTPRIVAQANERLRRAADSVAPQGSARSAPRGARTGSNGGRPRGSAGQRRRCANLRAGGAHWAKRERREPAAVPATVNGEAARYGH
jgi:hypothetical protein